LLIELGKIKSLIQGKAPTIMKIANPIDQTQSISANQQNQQKTKFHIIKTGLRNHQKKTHNYKH